MPTGAFNGHQVCRVLAISEHACTAFVCDHSVARGGIALGKDMVSWKIPPWALKSALWAC